LKRTLAALIAVACLLPACRGAGPRARAEAARLRRQTEGLRRLLAAADEGRLFTPDQLAIGVRQELVRDLLRKALPVEAMVGQQLRARLEEADVSFEDGQSLVTVKARVRPVQSGEAFADLTLFGGLRRFQVDPGTGMLSAHVELDRVEVRRVEAGALGRRLVESVKGLSGRGLEALGEVVPPIEVPVRLEQVIDFAGFTEGVVSVPPGRLPLHVSVAAVVPVAGRLWVLMDVSAGGAGRSLASAARP
jgi:hypothetical protein